ncbi:fructose-bisphosphate aldolase [Kiloniella spongiae]|uniref:Fructose-bisphosphate aldolase n=1 Tax=Kiloniella spongiae TaxID=1489064 RepID=A0A0H2MT32_9PROT|nr:class II fructose-bisphosphate aldolase [Kiloniella spongiae]KLN59850.1 fructose-bisphosphate aldolase [Kiloniella spongiae]
MTLATLSDVLQPAYKKGYAVPGLVVLGWEDARAFVTAAEQENAAVILQAGPGCRAHTPLPVLGAMFRALAEEAGIPVVAHLDHGYTIDECKEAIDNGFTSVMFDGSRKPLAQNISETKAIAELAHKAGVSCEGEIGFVGYDNGEASASTSATDAKRFAEETNVDAMAVSVGNVHLQQDKAAEIDINAVREIDACTDIPLVIHGGSGVPMETRRFLAHNTAISKFNIGTELRMTFGQSLRSILASDKELFDRISILKQTEEPLTQTVRSIIRNLLAT